jgi:hypothetical protein
MLHADPIAMVSIQASRQKRDRHSGRGHAHQHEMIDPRLAPAEVRNDTYPTFFRRCIWAGIGLHLASIFVDKWLPEQIPDALRDANLKLVEDVATSPTIIPLTVTGLYQFKPSARTPTLARYDGGLLFGLLAPAPYTYSLSSAFAESVSTVATALDGAVLAIAYFALPVKTLFDDDSQTV